MRAPKNHSVRTKQVIRRERIELLREMNALLEEEEREAPDDVSPIAPTDRGELSGDDHLKRLADGR